VETLFNSPDKFQSRFAVIDGYRTHYLEAGEDRANRLLLVHGGGVDIGMDAYRWYPTVIPLSKNFHVFAIDELGHGDTDPPRNPDDLWKPRIRAEHVIKFIEECKLAPVNLVGQSTGGWIVAYITLKRPDLVKKLVLIDSASAAGSALKSKDQGDKEEFVEIEGVMTPVTDRGELPYMQKIFVKGTMHPKEGMVTTREGLRTFLGAFIYNKAMITEEWLDHLLKYSRKWNPIYNKYKGIEFWEKTKRKGIVKEFFWDHEKGIHIRDMVKEIKVPTLIIWGKNSSKGLDPGVEFYKRIPGAQLHIFDKANHFLWLDQPEVFNGLVTWFLSKDQ